MIMNKMLILIGIMKAFFFYIFQFTFFSITAVAVAQNNALDFDGSNDYIQITDDAIIQLKERVVDRYYDPLQRIWRVITRSKVRM